MIVSSATAVLPVWRSPMISSRWPRPIGTMPSMALRPVCSGSRTGWRSTTPGREALDRQELLRGDRSLAVDRLAERVDDAAEHLLADRHRDDAAGALDRIAFLDLGVLAEQHRADAVLFEVERDAEHAVRELEHLAGHGALDAVHARDAVADRDHGADFGHVDGWTACSDLVADDLGDLFGSDIHLQSVGGGPPASSAARGVACSDRAPDLRELRGHAAVVDRAADPGHHAADNRHASRRSACACTRSTNAVSSFSACSGSDSVMATSNSALAYRAAEARVLMSRGGIYRRTSDAELYLKGTSNLFIPRKTGPF